MFLFIRQLNQRGTALYKLYRYVPPHRVVFLHRFGLKASIHSALFGLESGMDFEGTTRVFKSIYRKRNMQIRNALEEFF